MLGEVIERAAELAVATELTVEAALRRYQQAATPPTCHDAQVWVSVAFLVDRHAKMAVGG